MVDGLRIPYRLHQEDLSKVHLAPFYDVICTRIYETCTDEMSISINGQRNINQITREDCGGIRYREITINFYTAI